MIKLSDALYRILELSLSGSNRTDEVLLETARRGEDRMITTLLACAFRHQAQRRNLSEIWINFLKADNGNGFVIVID